MNCLKLLSIARIPRLLWTVCVIPSVALVAIYMCIYTYLSNASLMMVHFDILNSSLFEIQVDPRLDALYSKYENEGIRSRLLNWTMSSTSAYYNFTTNEKVQTDDALFRERITLKIAKEIARKGKTSVSDRHHFSSYPRIDMVDFMDDIASDLNAEKCPKDTYLAAFVHISYATDTLTRMAKIK